MDARKKVGSPTSRDSDKFILRLPNGMRELLAEFAIRNDRSMNAEIVARLRMSFDRDDTVHGLSHRVDELERWRDRITDDQDRD